MKLNLDNEALWLQDLPSPQAVRFLALQSHGLTISIRALCHVTEDSSEALECVRLLNEAHHRISSYVLHSQTGDQDAAWLHVIARYTLDNVNPVVYLQAAQAWCGAKVSLQGTR